MRIPRSQVYEIDRVYEDYVLWAIWIDPQGIILSKFCKAARHRAF